MRLKTALLGFLMLGIAPGTAQALTAEKYLEVLEADPVMAEFYAGSLGQGIQAASVYKEHTGGKPIYCPPSNLTLRHANYMDLIREGLEKTSSESYSEISIPVILVLELVSTFPCPSN